MIASTVGACAPCRLRPTKQGGRRSLHIGGGEAAGGGFEGDCDGGGHGMPRLRRFNKQDSAFGDSVLPVRVCERMLHTGFLKGHPSSPR